MAASAVVGEAGTASAEEICLPDDFKPTHNYPKICDAYVAPASIAVAYQKETQWCWAATASMIFRTHGRSVSQDKIVQRNFGNLVNQPSGFQGMLNALSGQYSDDSGSNFNVNLTGLYFSQRLLNSLQPNGVSALPPAMRNSDFIAELKADRPLLYCNTTHAMMLFQVNYIPPDTIVSAVVVDPWPGLGIRQLSPAELVSLDLGGQATMLARVDVS